MFAFLGDITDAVKWLMANLWLVAIGVVALVTVQFWLPAVVRLLTETKLGVALGAAAVVFGGGYLFLKKDRREHEAIGEARAERRMRERIAPTKSAKPAKQEWWKGKK